MPADLKKEKNKTKQERFGYNPKDKKSHTPYIPSLS